MGRSAQKREKNRNISDIYVNNWLELTNLVSFDFCFFRNYFQNTYKFDLLFDFIFKKPTNLVSFNLFKHMGIVIL